MNRRLRLSVAAGFLALTGVLSSAAESARGMAFDVYIRLKIGMNEAELLQRAGPPDHESDAGVDARARIVVPDVVVIDPASGHRVRRHDVVRSELSQPVKIWYYLPTTADPFTTAVTLTGGRISALERDKQF